LFLLYVHINAQNINGSVSDSLTHEKMGYCAVLLTKNDTLIKGTVTDNKGFFSIEKIQIGRYQIEIKYLGYKPFKKSLEVNAVHDNFYLGDIILTPHETLLNEVTLNVVNNNYRQTIDKTEVTFDKMDIKNNPKSLQALQKVSGLKVNMKQKSIEVLGSENTLLLVNGINKTTEEISSINTADIERVEIITSPGVQYDSTYMAIVNIIIKTNTQKGFQFDLDINGFIPNIYNFANVKLQYGFDKVKLYSSYNLWNRSSGEKKFIYEQNNFNEVFYEIKDTLVDNKKRLQISHYFNSGSDVFLNEKSFINISGDFKTYKQDIQGSQKTFFYQNNEHIDLDILKNIEVLDKKSQNFSIFYNYNFSQNESIYASANYYKTNLNFDRTNILSSDNDITETSNYKTYRVKGSKNIKVNYSNLFAQKYKIESGIYAYFQELNTNHKENDILVNNTNYNDIRSNIYLNIITKINKIDLSIGISEEFQKMDLNKQSNNSVNFLPSSKIQYSLTNTQKIGVGFNKKIKYPNTYQLADYTMTRDSYNIFKGNPNVKAFTINSVFANYTYRKDKFFFNPTLSFTFIKNPINQIINITEDQLFLHTYDNIGNTNEVALRVQASFSLGKIELNPSLNIKHSIYQTPLGNWRGNQLSFNINPEYTFINGLNIGVNFDYTSKNVIFQGYEKSSPLFDFTFGKNFLNDIFQIKIDICPFNDKYTTVYNIDNTYLKEQTIEYYQNINFQIIYSFKSGNELKKKNKYLNKDEDF